MQLNGSEQYKGSDVVFKVTLTNPAESTIDLTDCDVEMLLSGKQGNYTLSLTLSIGDGLTRETNQTDTQVIRGVISAASLAAAVTPLQVGYHFRVTAGGNTMIAESYRGNFWLMTP